MDVISWNLTLLQLKLVIRILLLYIYVASTFFSATD